MLVILKLPPTGKVVATPLAIPAPETRQAVLDITCAVLNGADKPKPGRKKRLQDGW